MNKQGTPPARKGGTNFFMNPHPKTEAPQNETVAEQVVSYLKKLGWMVEETTKEDGTVRYICIEVNVLENSIHIYANCHSDLSHKNAMAYAKELHAIFGDRCHVYLNYQQKLKP